MFDSIIYNSHNTETTKVSPDRRMNEEMDYI